MNYFCIGILDELLYQSIMPLLMPFWIKSDKNVAIFRSSNSIYLYCISKSIYWRRNYYWSYAVVKVNDLFKSSSSHDLPNILTSTSTIDWFIFYKHLKCYLSFNARNTVHYYWCKEQNKSIKILTQISCSNDLKKLYSCICTFLTGVLWLC